MAEKKVLTVSHDGHRQRVKERYAQAGLKGFSGHEVLEFLLFYAIPYKDTNGLAHRLVDAFGSLTNVLEAKPADLLKVPGVTPHIATMLSLCGDVCRRYYAELGGLDAIAFTGGVGEHDKYLRAEVLRQVAHMGLKLDEARNDNDEFTITTDDSPVSAHVIPADEEDGVATNAYRLLTEGK